MILADTGYFIALLNPDDGLHARAQAWARSLREPLLVTEHVLWETVNAFSNPADRARVATLMTFVRSSAFTVIDASPQIFEQGVQLHTQRSDKEWSLTDCISFVVMQERGLTRALAYDHHFIQAGFEPLLRRDPTENG